jgi:hypothetical protein
MILHPLVARGNAIVVKKIFKREGERERENIQQPSFHPHPTYPLKNTPRAGGLQRRRAFFNRVKHIYPAGGIDISAR